MAYFAPPQLGELRHRIYIEGIASESTNAFNEVSQSYSTLASRWAKIDTTRPEALSLNQASTRASLEHVEIIFRYWQGLTVNHRLRYGSGGLLSLTTAQYLALTTDQYLALTSSTTPINYYRITGIHDPDNRRKWMVIEAVRSIG